MRPKATRWRRESAFRVEASDRSNFQFLRVSAKLLDVRRVIRGGSSANMDMSSLAAVRLYEKG